MDLTPPILEGRHVRLEPLSPEHASLLAAVAFDPVLWRFTPTQIHAQDDLEAYIESALSSQKAGTAIPFATMDRATGQAIGSTRFGNINASNRRVEIGWTWLGCDYQRRAFNTEAKLLMLTHAFEALACVRVEICANVQNMKSRTAIERIGAREEGTLRHHQVHPDGSLVDYAYYSILRDEWPDVRKGLESKLAAREGVTGRGGP